MNEALRLEPKTTEPIRPVERGAIIGAFINWALDTVLELPQAKEARLLRSKGKKTGIENPFLLNFIINGMDVTIRNDLFRSNTPTDASATVTQGLELYIGPTGSTEKTDEDLAITAHTEYSVNPSTNGRRTYIDGGVRTWNGMNLDIDLLASSKVNKKDAQRTLKELKKSVQKKLGLEHLT